MRFDRCGPQSLCQALLWPFMLSVLDHPDLPCSDYLFSYHSCHQLRTWQVFQGLNLVTATYTIWSVYSFTSEWKSTLGPCRFLLQKHNLFETPRITQDLLITLPYLMKLHSECVGEIFTFQMRPQIQDLGEMLQAYNWWCISVMVYQPPLPPPQENRGQRGERHLLQIVLNKCNASKPNIMYLP